ncbi:hypothetical protein BC793_108368 [Actinoplanes xinjiangensis]|uniref:Uncharacterized protein n=2 Tax=Actinoplanes xinjiangensis TaxID=512350 RepID=A0A316FG21_9ACTN|nr:hypothetical protein BC793_108368 [Actinoplanes xinjiangensis]GIF40413.1 hypothetical protein Axi01nite_47240 [Actinoplanes xinjiangensis]
MDFDGGLAAASLSRMVTNSLKAIGFVVHRRGQAPVGEYVGVLVEEGFPDEEGGVFVSWHTSKEMRVACRAAIDQDDLKAPAFRMSAGVEYTIFQMLLSVLTEAGFEAAEADGFRHMQIHVIGVTGPTLGDLVEPI